MGKVKCLTIINNAEILKEEYAMGLCSWESEEQQLQS